MNWYYIKIISSWWGIEFAESFKHHSYKIVYTIFVRLMLNLSPDDGISDYSNHCRCQLVGRWTCSVVDSHQFWYACLCQSLEGHFLIWETLCHLVEYCSMGHCRVVHPEHFTIGWFSTCRCDDLIDDLSESLLVHGWNVVEARTVLIDVGTNTRTLSRNVSMIFDNEEITCRKRIWILGPLEVPYVRTWNEVLGFRSEDSDLWD